jgi:hypothetical protein
MVLVWYPSSGDTQPSALASLLELARPLSVYRTRHLDAVGLRVSNGLQPDDSPIEPVRPSLHRDCEAEGTEVTALPS